MLVTVSQNKPQKYKNTKFSALNKVEFTVSGIQFKVVGHTKEESPTHNDERNESGKTNPERTQLSALVYKHTEPCTADS